EPDRKVPDDACVLAYRSDRRAGVVEEKRHGAFLRRSVRSGAKTRLRNPGRARGRPVLAESRWHGLEIQTELVCARQPRSDGSPGFTAFRFEAHEGANHRTHVEPCADVVASRRGAQCDPQGGKLCRLSSMASLRSGSDAFPVSGPDAFPTVTYL